MTIRPPTDAQNLAPRSLDMVRVIRRSLRCLLFGWIGLVPLFGIGFACQAMRLRRRVSADLGDDWTPPPVYCYWLLGAVGMVAVTSWIGLWGDLALCGALLGLQSWHCWRRHANRPQNVWNPADRELFLGTLFAYAGLGLSLWTVVVLVLVVVQIVAPA
jgi:hypothetical protein